MTTTANIGYAIEKPKFRFSTVNVVVMSFIWLLISRPGDLRKTEILMYRVTDPNGVLPDVLIFDCGCNDVQTAADEEWPDEGEWIPGTNDSSKHHDKWFEYKKVDLTGKKEGGEK